MTKGTQLEASCVETTDGRSYTLKLHINTRKKHGAREKPLCDVIWFGLYSGGQRAWSN